MSNSASVHAPSDDQTLPPENDRPQSAERAASPPLDDWFDALLGAVPCDDPRAERLRAVLDSHGTVRTARQRAMDESMLRWAYWQTIENDRPEAELGSAPPTDDKEQADVFCGVLDAMKRCMEEDDALVALIIEHGSHEKPVCEQNERCAHSARCQHFGLVTSHNRYATNIDGATPDQVELLANYDDRLRASIADWPLANLLGAVRVLYRLPKLAIFGAPFTEAAMQALRALPSARDVRAAIAMNECIEFESAAIEAATSTSVGEVLRAAALNRRLAAERESEVDDAEHRPLTAALREHGGAAARTFTVELLRKVYNDPRCEL